MTDRRDKSGPAIAGAWPETVYIGDSRELFYIFSLNNKAKVDISNTINIVDRAIHNMMKVRNC